jgi:hypothetical protein
MCTASRFHRLAVQLSELVITADRARIIVHINFFNSSVKGESVRVIPDIGYELIHELHIVGVEDHFDGAVRQV